MINDLINGLFEFIGAIACWLNVYKIIKDKCVKGVYWPLSLFFTTWGIWNLYYYFSLNQLWSVCGAVVMALANATWVLLAIKYRNR